jgi:hypothetical protein
MRILPTQYGQKGETCFVGFTYQGKISMLKPKLPKDKSFV